MEALRGRQRVPSIPLPNQINQSVIYITDFIESLHYTTPNIIRFTMKGAVWLLQRLKLSLLH